MQKQSDNRKLLTVVLMINKLEINHLYINIRHPTCRSPLIISTTTEITLRRPEISHLHCLKGIELYSSKSCKALSRCATIPVTYRTALVSTLCLFAHWRPVLLYIYLQKSDLANARFPFTLYTEPYILLWCKRFVFNPKKSGRTCILFITDVLYYF